MGKRIILSEEEKLNIKGLYSEILNEQSLPPKDDGPKKSPPVSDVPKKEIPKRLYLPVAGEFCEVLTGKGQLKRGAKGDLVTLFQTALMQCVTPPKSYLNQYGADGKYGNETITDVKDFQKENGLTVDGGIGPETAGKMCELGCLPKELCSSCKSSKGGNKPGEIRDGGINVDCERVQGCISEFMLEYKGDSCLDEGMLKKLLQCVGVGQCFEGGKVPIKRFIEKPGLTIDV